MAGRNNMYKTVYFNDIDKYDRLEAALALHQLNLSKLLNQVIDHLTDTLTNAAMSGQRLDEVTIALAPVKKTR